MRMSALFLREIFEKYDTIRFNQEKESVRIALKD